MGGEKAARTLSIVLSPQALAILAFAGVSAASCPEAVAWAVPLTASVYAGLPAVLVAVEERRSGSKDHEFSLDQRASVMARCVPAYALGSLLMLALGLPTPMWGLGLMYAANTTLNLAVNRFWRMSVHAFSAAGALSLLTLFYWPEPALAGAAILPAVFWARLRLRAHTPGQLLGGAILGALISWMEMRVILSLP